MKILQEYVLCVTNEKECVYSVCLQSASNFVAISSLVVKLLNNAGFGSEWDTLYIILLEFFIIRMLAL